MPSRLWLLPLAWPGLAAAAVEFVPYGSAQYQHYSNLFEVSGKDEAEAQQGDRQLDDTAWQGKAGVEANLRSGEDRQQLQMIAEGRRLLYSHYSDIDHNEYTLSGKLDWKLGAHTDGNLSFRQDRSLASFANLDTSELTLQTERRAQALAGYDVTPRWRGELGGELTDSKLPLPDDPDFRLKEGAGSVAIKYRSNANVTAGLLNEFRDGRYEGSPERRSDYTEFTSQATVDYAVSGLSRLTAKVGGTRRSQDTAQGSGTTSGFTGDLGYLRTISAKTSVDLGVFRRIESFVAGASALVSTGFNLGANWSPTPSMTVSSRYEYVNSDFGTSGNEDQGRKDHYQTANLELRYLALHWLTLRPFLTYRDRSSSFDSESFDNLMIGAELGVRFD